jgi:hypothetical protein
MVALLREEAGTRAVLETAKAKMMMRMGKMLRVRGTIS